MPAHRRLADALVVLGRRPPDNPVRTRTRTQRATAASVALPHVRPRRPRPPGACVQPSRRTDDSRSTTTGRVRARATRRGDRSSAGARAGRAARRAARTQRGMSGWPIAARRACSDGRMGRMQRPTPERVEEPSGKPSTSSRLRSLPPRPQSSSVPRTSNGPSRDLTDGGSSWTRSGKE